MKTTSKYSQPLEPDELEQAARRVYGIHQSGAKNRGDQIEKILARHKATDHNTIMLRAQRLALDGLPPAKVEKAAKTPVESSPPPTRANATPGKEKRNSAKPRAKAKASSKPSQSHNGKKPAVKPNFKKPNTKLPF
jgi:hypothetical protein